MTRRSLNKTVHAPAALKYFEEKIGLKMQVIRDCPDYYYRHVEDSVAEGRMLEVEPFPGADARRMAIQDARSPQMPYGLTHHDISNRAASRTWRSGTSA